MKTFMYILLVISIMSCAKNNVQPTPVVPVSTMTSMESSLVGKWYVDSNVVYSADIRIAAVAIIDTGSYRDMKSTLLQNIVSTPQFYDEVDLLLNILVHNVWEVQLPVSGVSTKYKLATYSNTAYIESVSSTRLILVDWPGTTKTGIVQYFHK